MSCRVEPLNPTLLAVNEHEVNHVVDWVIICLDSFEPLEQRLARSNGVIDGHVEVSRDVRSAFHKLISTLAMTFRFWPNRPKTNGWIGMLSGGLSKFRSSDRNAEHARHSFLYIDACFDSESLYFCSDAASDMVQYTRVVSQVLTSGNIDTGLNAGVESNRSVFPLNETNFSKHPHKIQAIVLQFAARGQCHIIVAHVLPL